MIPDPQRAAEALAEASRIVCEDAAQTDRLQERQPGQTTFLVRTQLARETLRRRHR